MHTHVSYDWLLSAAALYIYSAAIQSLPAPEESQKWYAALYRFLHLLGANFKQLSITKPPSEPEAKK
jgi:hypothetical protein